ncbi:DUF2312 domain-containing protein [Pseudomonadota bacterium]
MENKVDQRLKQFVEGIERLEQEKTEIARQTAEVYKDAKSSGFDTRIIRKIISIRKMDKEELQEQEYLLETYKEALGMSD